MTTKAVVERLENPQSIPAPDRSGSWRRVAQITSAAIALAAAIYATRTPAAPTTILLLLVGVWLALTPIALNHDADSVSPMGIAKTARRLRGMLLALLVAGCVLLLAPHLSLAWAGGMFAGSCVITWGNRPYNASSEKPATYVHCKRAIDFLLSLVAILALAPLLIVVALAIRLDSAGPIFFSHDRVGRGGRIFRILKFRSMYTDAERYHRSPTSTTDPRITRVGRVIRRCSIDELPQLFNVLCGEMSLIGPRPEMPFVVDGYEPEQHERFAVLPGITGLWQISPARAFPIHEHLEYDFYYIAHRSFFLDLAIFFRTFTAIVRGIGAA